MSNKDGPKPLAPHLNRKGGRNGTFQLTERPPPPAPMHISPAMEAAGTRPDELLVRANVMRLIEAEITCWSDGEPPRHALSVLWGKVRDMKAAP